MQSDNNNEKPFDLEKVQEKLKNVKSLEDLTGTDGVIQEMVQSTVNRILQAEQEEHLGYKPHEAKGQNTGNSRNGYSKKNVKTSSGEVEVDVPRDRQGTFEPQLIEKHKSFDSDLEKRITSLYAKGMSVRDIQTQLEEFYGTEVSSGLVSKVTDKILEGIKEWQARPLDSVYPVVFMDAIHYKIRHEGKVVSRAAYTCLAVNMEGKVEVLGIWIAEKEGAHFWQSVLSDLKSRGVEDILIACVDGLKGFPEAIGNIFPETVIQLCVVHQIRASLRYLSTKHHKEFLKDLKDVYKASTLENAEHALEHLEQKWSSTAKAAVAVWKNNWQHISAFFDFPEEIRRMIYTTNAVEALHRQFRKVTKSKGAFPTDEALKKMLYLATLDMKGALRSKRNWPKMLGQLKVVFEDRIPERAV